ncbi:hypothetical protein IWX90DRAFT_440734 [Phyllosticta citrichinensis]|uniref:Uncharacterized protein n=1 Tax=Phyllosticta citrichinensis TaxID=1130410 RepID=A0ABR1XL62_9PEZI
MSLSSSPDPLCLVTSSPTKHDPDFGTLKRSSKPLASRSPNVLSSDPFAPSSKLSPSKSITMTTPKGKDGSPWRIKVTVEAEPGESQDENSMSSPTSKRSTRIISQTTSVPLNDAEGQSPVKRRGRPRKSDAALVSNPQTKSVPLNDASSPARRRGRPRKSDTVPALTSQVEAGAEIESGISSPTKRRGRPRKSDAGKDSPKPRTRTPVRRSRRSIVRSPEESQESSAEDESYKPRSRPQTRTRKPERGDSQVPEPILADAMYGPRSLPSPHAQPDAGHNAQQSGRSTRTTRRSVRESRRTRNSDVFSAPPDAHSDESEDQEDQQATPRAASSQPQDDDASMWQSMVSHQNNNQGVPSEEHENSDDELDIVRPDDVGDTTMLHSEEFSMVSLDSLPSMQVARGPKQAEIPEPKALARAKPPVFGTDPIPRHRPHAISRNAISSPIPDVNDSVVSVSYMPSSPPVRFPVRTPSDNQKLKSPSAPPAVEHAHFSPTTADTPKLLNIVSAGRALQGVLGRNEEETSGRRGSADSSTGSQRNEANSQSANFQANLMEEANSHFGDQLNQSTQSSRQETCSKVSTPQDATKDTDTNAPDGSVFDGPSTSSAQNSSSFHRLPTPEESQPYSLTSPPPPVSQLVTEHSTLEPAAQPTQLISPARSHQSQTSEEDDAGAHTPESEADVQQQEQSSSELPSNVDSSLTQKPGENFDAYWQRRREAISRRIAEASPGKVVVINSETSNESGEFSELPQSQEDAKVPEDDIWEEEASRSSETRAAARRQRRERRRQAAEDSENSSVLNTSSHGNERSSGRTAQSSGRGSSSRQDQDAPSSSGSRAQSSSNRESSAPRSSQRASQSNPGSDANESDNTGFWRASSEPRPPFQIPQDRRDDGLSAIMDQIQTPQDQTPRATPQKVPVFKAPYNVGGVFNSPVRSSPLRQQVMFSSPSAVNSSPYQKNQMIVESSMMEELVVEEPETESSEASDIKQLRKELSARRRSSGAFENRRMSQIFDEEDEQIEKQIEEERTQRLSLDHSTANLSKDYTVPSVASVEASQHSRVSATRLSAQSRSGAASRPRNPLFDGPVPRLAPGPVRPNGDDTLRSVDTTHDDGMDIDGEEYSRSSVRQEHSHMMSLNMNRSYPRLFEEQNSIGSQGQGQLHRSSSSINQPEPQPVSQQQQQQQGGGLFGRIWSSIAPFQQESKPEPAPIQPTAAAPQPISQTVHRPSISGEPTPLPKPTRLRHHKDLPKLKPFSKTHFLTLHHIWSRYLSHPAEFSLSHTSNQRLVAQPVFNDCPTPIPGVHGHPPFLPLAVYFDITFRNRGYEVKFPEELIVIAALFMTLLSLDDEAAYMARYGEPLRWEEVRKKGEGRIGGFEVIQRLGFLEVGRIIRRHEALGKPVSTVGGAYVRWPVATPGPGWVPLPR